MEKFSGRLTLIRLTNKNQLLSFESHTALEHLKAVAERYLKKGRLLKEIIEKGISKLEKKNDFDLQRLGMASLLKKVQDASNMLSLGEKLTEIVDGYLIAPALVASFQTGLESRMRVDQDYNRFVSADRPAAIVFWKLPMRQAADCQKSCGHTHGETTRTGSRIDTHPTPSPSARAASQNRLIAPTTE